jgi:Ca2+-binding EF-hand superfamily protein
VVSLALTRLSTGRWPHKDGLISLEEFTSFYVRQGVPDGEDWARLSPGEHQDLEALLDMFDVFIATVSGDEKSAHASIMTRTEFIEKITGNFKKLFDAMDTDGNGFVDKVEFLAMAESISGSLGNASQVAEVLSVFARFDTNKVTACGSDNGSKFQHTWPPEQCSVILD